MSTWYPEADLIIKHPKIYTVALTIDDVKRGNFEFPVIEDGGVAVKGTKIIAVGTADEIGDYEGTRTKVIDAAGKILTPGFCESHMHASDAAQELRMVNFRPACTRQEALDLIKAQASITSDGEWIEGIGWNELLWDDPRMITREELDEVCPNNPCYFIRICHHVAMVNSEALRIAEIDRTTPQPEGAVIEHDDAGEPNGLLFEMGAMDLVGRNTPQITDDQRVKNLEDYGRVLNSMGITSVIDANLTTDQMRAYGLADRQRKLSFRVNGMFYIDATLGDAEFNMRRLNEMGCITGVGNEYFKLNAVKVLLDGIPAVFTAFMRKPYKTNPETRGSTIWTEEELNAFVCRAHELGWQFGIHTIGDAAVDIALHAYELADQISPIQDCHDYIIHVQVPHEDQLEIMKRLNVGATVQPTLVSTMGEAPLFEKEEADRFQSPGLFFDNGVIVGGSSDCPVTTPDPLVGMYYAITRIDETTGEPFEDASRVTPEQALIMWTKNGAFFSHDEDVMGSIEEGNFADFIIFDRDFIAGPPEGYREAQIEKTFVGGQIVYENRI